MTLISIFNNSKRTKITGRPHKEAVNFDEIQVYNMVILLPTYRLQYGLIVASIGIVFYSSMECCFMNEEFDQNDLIPQPQIEKVRDCSIPNSHWGTFGKTIYRSCKQYIRSSGNNQSISRFVIHSLTTDQAGKTL